MTESMSSGQLQLFRFTSTIHHEMKRFRDLMALDAERGKELFAVGNNLVSLAAGGHHRKFCDSCSQLAASDSELPLIYFVSKALEESLLAHHLMIAAYIIDNGYPLSDQSLPNIAIAIMKSDKSDSQCADIVDFLSSKKYEFNGQEPKTWLSALHYATQCGLVHTARRLIEHKADVNAVADQDLLPLSLALQLADHSENHEQIRQLLVENGARETWRRGITFSSPTGFAITETTSIAVKKPESATTAPSQQKRQLMSFRGGFDAPLIITPQAPVRSNVGVPFNATSETDICQGEVLVGESDDGNAFLFSTANS